MDVWTPWARTTARRDSVRRSSDDAVVTRERVQGPSPRAFDATTASEDLAARRVVESNPH